MAVFSYKARNGSGSLISGDLEALSEDDLLRKLQALNYMPVRVSREEEGQKNISWNALFPPKVKTKDIVMMNMKLAYMADAGIPLLNSMRLLAVQVENPLLKEILLDVSQKVFEGSSLSDALSNHPAVFSQMYVSMVKVGEISGTLHIVLNRMAAYMEKEEELKQKVQGALFYPMILLSAGCIVIVLIVTFVIPQFVSIFSKANVTLPLPTLILYYFGEFLKRFWFLILPAIFSAVYLTGRFFKTTNGKNYFDRMILKVPYVGRLVKQVFITRFCRALGILLESDVPVLKCLDVVKEVVGNSVYQRIIMQISESVQRGEKISHQLSGSEYFPNDVVSMISTGEETGKLAPMLYKVAGFYESVVDDSVKKLTLLIEPFFIVFMGLLAGLIMTSMLLPLFDMVKTIQQ
jgi:type IV pilus assembly protein PilC